MLLSPIGFGFFLVLPIVGILNQLVSLPIRAALPLALYLAAKSLGGNIIAGNKILVAYQAFVVHSRFLLHKNVQQAQTISQLRRGTLIKGGFDLRIGNQTKKTGRGVRYPALGGSASGWR
jgi:hypothetical protein